MPKYLNILSALVLMAIVPGHAADQLTLQNSYVNASGEYNVKITQGNREALVDITRHNGSQESVVHYVAKDMSFSFIGTSPRNDYLAIVWDDGNAKYVTVFSLAPSSRTPVFAGAAPDGDPEFLIVNQQPLMIFYSGRHHIGDHWIPRNASFYIWDGAQFRLLKTVPYAGRFRALGALEKGELH